MTIPAFDSLGNLPSGIHYCSWNDFINRFETTPRRRRLIDGLTKAMTHLKNAGCLTVYINGSFVTDKLNPNDFDACWDSEGVDFNYLKINAPELLNFSDRRMAQKAKYYGELFPSELIINEEGNTALDLFQVDINQNRKGIVAIDLKEWQS